MNAKHLGGLVALNAVLLLALGVLSFAPESADAQIGADRPADYVMVGGRTRGQINNSIYITDVNNALMVAITYDINRRALVPVGGRNLADDFRINTDR